MWTRAAVTVVFMARLALGQESSQQPGVDDVRKMLDAQTAAWNRGDLRAFMDGYWNSPDLTFFGRDTIVKGWAQTLERYRAKYQAGGAPLGHLSFSEQHIEMLGPSSAMMTARWRLAMPDGKKLEGLTTVICKRMKDGWKIVHDHSS